MQIHNNIMTIYLQHLYYVFMGWGWVFRNVEFVFDNQLGFKLRTVWMKSTCNNLRLKVCFIFYIVISTLILNRHSLDTFYLNRIYSQFMVNSKELMIMMMVVMMTMMMMMITFHFLKRTWNTCHFKSINVQIHSSCPVSYPFILLSQ